MTLLNNDLIDEVTQINGDHGFNDYQEVLNNYGPEGAGMYIDRKLLLAVGELIEAQEELRSGHATDEVYFNDEKPEGFLVEAADAVYRIFGLVGELNLVDEFVQAFEVKKQYNASRPYKHGRAF